MGTLIAAPAWNNDLQVTFTGTRNNQPDCVVTVALPSPLVVTPIDLGSCGILTSLTISSQGGTNAGIGGTGTHVAFSNVEIRAFTSPLKGYGCNAVDDNGNGMVGEGMRHVDNSSAGVSRFG